MGDMADWINQETGADEMAYASGDDEVVEVDCHVIKETEKALLLNDGKIESWVPKSLVEDMSFHKETDIQKTCTVTMPEWLAIDKGFV